MSKRVEARCFLLDTDGLTAILGEDPSNTLADLAAALVGSEPWRAVSDRAAVVVALNPPRLALIGKFDDSDLARINGLRTQLDLARRGFHFVDYVEAERLAVDVAGRLVQTVGATALREASLLAIPRGGHIVLGMLSYALGVQRNQQDLQDSALWIVVDDCAISGTAFLRWLETHPGPEVVFAHLYSHPDLRRALERHPRVRACIAAADLVDHAPARLGAGYAEWKAAWQERDAGAWTGQTDQISFAWNEPDTAMWNPVSGRIERGWNLIGPQRCLKNRQRGSAGAIQMHSSADGDLQVGANVMWARVDNEIVVADTATDTVVSLSGVGAAMWLEAIRAPTEMEALARLGAQFDVATDRLQADWEEFVGMLIARGLLLRG